MKKILSALLGLLVASSASAQTTESSAINNLMGLGMPAALAEEVADLVTGDAVFANNQYIRFRNAAGTANIDVLKVDGSDETYINADTGDEIVLAIAGTGIARVAAGGILPEQDGNNTTSNLGSATKGFKNLFLTDATRDASLFVSNGLYVSYPSGQGFIVREGSTDYMTLGTGGTLTMARTTDLGWAVVAGANTACNTTCTSACVFGVNTAATEADIVGCADATADECLCAGAS